MVFHYREKPRVTRATKARKQRLAVATLELTVAGQGCVHAFNFQRGKGGGELEARPRFDSNYATGDLRVRVISLQILNGTCKGTTRGEREREIFFVPKS